MKTGTIISLPVAKQAYQMDDEQLTRRTIEQALSSLRQDVAEAHEIKATQLSLALRRFQFLLMGESTSTSAITSRELLVANRTYYVRTDGSDSNAGLSDSAGGAFLTIQKALNVIAGTLDIAGYQVVIQVADGTYTTPVIVPIMVGLDAPSDLVLRGNTGTPANVIISTTSASAITLVGSQLTFEGGELRTTTSGDCVNASAGAAFFANGIRFGACANAHLHAIGASIEMDANYTVAGNAVYHFLPETFGITYCWASTVTISGTPAFSTAFAYAETGVVQTDSTFSGSATGKRYDANMNGVIQTYGGGATFFPGDASGTTATGGQYA